MKAFSALFSIGFLFASNASADVIRPADEYSVSNPGQQLYIFRALSLVEGESAKQQVVVTEVVPRCVYPLPQGCPYSIPEVKKQENLWVPAGVNAQHYTIWNDDLMLVTKGHPRGYRTSTASYLTPDVKYNVLVDINRFHQSIGAICSAYTRNEVCSEYEHTCLETDPVSNQCRRFSEAKCKSYNRFLTCRPSRYYIHNPTDNNATTVPAREVVETCTDSIECSKYGFPSGASKIINFLTFTNR